MKEILRTAFIRFMVAIKGKHYIPIARPDDVPRMKMGHCSDNCAELCHKLEGYRYVEGLVYVPHQKKTYWHVWMTKDGIHSIDPTWGSFDNYENERAFPGIYKGIEMPIPAVRNFMFATGYTGILPNFFKNTRFSKKCLI